MAALEFESELLADFSGGIFRESEGQRAPRNTCLDIVDGLLDEDGAVYRRGGSVYDSAANSAGTIYGLVDQHFAAGQRTLIWSASATQAMTGAGATPATIDAGATSFPAAYGRPANVGGVLCLPVGAWGALGVTIGAYAGSLKAAAYSTGTVTVTLGSRTVTGAGTAWLANADVGMIFVSPNAGFSGQRLVVESVDSDTALTLREPWPYATAAGATYQVRPFAYISVVLKNADATSLFVASAGQRLWVAGGNRILMSAPPLSGVVRPFTFSPDTDFHQLPAAARILGAADWRDTVVAFSTQGVYAISNASLDPIDDFGNLQQTVELVENGLILWGNAGIAGHRGAFVVPALDDVYLWAPGSALSVISKAIRPLYRSYVKAGYKPGLAAVYRGHYFLPIVQDATSATVIDVLVGRLDGVDSRGNQRVAWTRWAGHAGASNCFAQRTTSSGTPSLISTKGQRTLDVSGGFVPAAAIKNDADGTTHQLTLITRDLAVHASLKTFWKKIRLRSEVSDAAADNPTVTAEYSITPAAPVFTALAGSAPESDGTVPYSWLAGKKSQAIRFRLKTVGPCASAVIRSLEVFYRRTGRQ